METANDTELGITQEELAAINGATAGYMYSQPTLGEIRDMIGIKYRIRQIHQLLDELVIHIEKMTPAH